MTSEPPAVGIVYVPDAERATYVRQPGEIVIGDQQLAGLARILGPAVERVVARKRALKQKPGQAFIVVPVLTLAYYLWIILFGWLT